MSTAVYVNLKEISRVSHKEIQLKDVADVFCDDSSVGAKCKALRVFTVREDQNKRYVVSSLEVIRLITHMNPALQVNNVGEVDFIIDYQKPKAPHKIWDLAKAVFVCSVCFCGAAFAIITFNNDVSVTSVFQEIYRIIMGKESTGFTILEVSYSIGLALGILVFFNHFAKIKVNTDPTPLEVEMRLYEDNISKTIIQNSERKESHTNAS